MQFGDMMLVPSQVSGWVTKQCRASNQRGWQVPEDVISSVQSPVHWAASPAPPHAPAARLQNCAHSCAIVWPPPVVGGGSLPLTPGSMPPPVGSVPVLVGSVPLGGGSDAPPPSPDEHAESAQAIAAKTTRGFMTA